MVIINGTMAQQKEVTTGAITTAQAIQAMDLSLILLMGIA